MKRHYSTVLQIIGGLVCVLIWLKLINLEKVIDNIIKVSIPIVILALFVYLVSFVIRSFRWSLILKSLKQVGYSKVFKIYMAGNLVNFIIPIRLGEIVKSVFLRKLDNIPLSKSLPTIVLDKIADLLPIIVILAGMFMMPISFNPTIWIISFSILVILLIMLAMVLLSTKYKHLLTKFFMLFLFWMPKKLQHLLKDFLNNFLSGFSIVRKGYVVPILCLTLLAIISDATYFMLMLAAFGYTANFLVVVIGYTLFTLSFILPTPPAQIGSNEVILLLIFSGVFGVDKNLVSAATLVGHFLTGILIITVGLFSVYGLKAKLSWLRIKEWKSM